MTAPKRGERVEILWPGGDYDFVMEVYDVQQQPGGWVLLHGAVVKPYRMVREFYVRSVRRGTYALSRKLL